MKAMKKLVAVIVMAVVLLVANLNLNAQSGGGGGTSTSQVTPAQLPIADVNDLQAYAWEHVAWINVSGFSWSAINSSTNVKSYVSVPYPRDQGANVEYVLSVIKQQKLALSVLYPSESFNLYVEVNDEAGNNLFYGKDGAQIATPQNGISRNTINMVLQMNPNISIDFPGAQWFQIVERDAAGNAIRYYYSREWEVYNGKLLFPAYFAKKFGELIVTLTDGTQVAYALNGGKQIVPTTVEIGIGNVSVLGTRTLRETNVVFIEISEEELKQNVNPLVQFVNYTDGWVYLAARIRLPNGQIEYAESVSIWQQGSPPSTAEIINIPWGCYTPRPRLLGPNWIKFQFRNFPGDRFGPPYEGEGGQTTVKVSEEK